MADFEQRIVSTAELFGEGIDETTRDMSEVLDAMGPPPNWQTPAEDKETK